MVDAELNYHDLRIVQKNNNYNPNCISLSIPNPTKKSFYCWDQLLVQEC